MRSTGSCSGSSAPISAPSARAKVAPLEITEAAFGIWSLLAYLQDEAAKYWRRGGVRHYQKETSMKYYVTLCRGALEVGGHQTPATSSPAEGGPETVGGALPDLQQHQPPAVPEASPTLSSARSIHTSWWTSRGTGVHALHLARREACPCATKDHHRNAVGWLVVDVDGIPPGCKVRVLDLDVEGRTKRTWSRCRR